MQLTLLIKGIAPREMVPVTLHVTVQFLLFCTWLLLFMRKFGLLHCRLVDETFTIDEVSEVLSGLQAVVHSEVESELINTAYTNVLLLRQLFSQAEKWYLKLQTDISELENR